MNENIERFKKIYWNISVSNQQVEKSWQELRSRLNPSVKTPFPFFRYGIAVFSFLLVFVAGTVGLAQAATPGTTFYPIKVLSDQVYAKVSGQPQIKTERRAEEVIKTVKKQPDKLEEASKQYQQTLDETQKEVENNPAHQDQLRKSLDKQEEQLKEAIKENPKLKGRLEKVLEDTREVKENLKENRKEKRQGSD